MLDAAGPALALETVAVSTAIAPTSDDPAATPPVANLNGNTAPSDIVIQTPIVINENGVATLSLTFNDPDALDAHTIEVDWQDGTTESFSLAAGVTSFSTTHQYLDDNLPGPATEDYDVAVRVIDSASEFADETSKITVLNVAPANLQISPVTPINENGVATLQLSFDDPGTVDDHTVEVDWGDGSAVQVFTVPTGDRTFSATHKYLDDNPTGTASDSYAIHVRLTDDDLGETTAATVAKVNNVAPFNVQIQSIQPVNEDGVASLAIAFNDPGTLDSHTVEVDWGDGTVETLSVAVGARNLTASHQYLDDNPTGTSSDVYAVKVRVLDDDLGEGSATKGVTVVNVAPSNVQINPIAPIDENGVAVLNLAFNDPGTLDSHTVEVDWGDGTVETLAVAAGSRTFTATHQYLDDNPTGTSSDVYTVNVKVRDDDGGQASGSATAKVLNVPPSNVVVSPVATITKEGTQVNLDIAFDDAGSQDTHQVEINWGDGNVTTVTAVGHALNANHTYGDNGTYAVIVKVTDDDGGAGFGSAAVQVNNVAPSNVQIQPIAAIDENGVATLELTFDDPGTLDGHTVEVDWGDGTVETLAVAAGSRTFTANHQYLDDNPTGTAADVYTVNVKVRDDDGGLATALQTVQVSNVAPSNVQIQLIAAIDENGVATLELTFDDPGTLDSHTVEVDWGDGTVETLAVAAGSRTFTANHQYLDDNPTGTSSDVYTVNVKVRDDDGGLATALQTVQVSNVAPSNVQIQPIAAIDENGVATLELTFDDPGTLDSHTVEVDWGDGTVETLAVAAGSRTFTATHQYLDDNPTGTSSDVYTVDVRVRDDDGGQATANSTVNVSNVAPSNVLIAPVGSSIAEGGGVNLGIMFDDPGSQDSHQVEINWGDGQVTTGTATGYTFSASHVYADNGTYAVHVNVVDDDGGVRNGLANVFVANVAPSVTVVGPQTVDEGSLLSLTNIGQFTDPGFDNPLNAGNILNGGETTEEFTYEINWGDGSAVETGLPTIDQIGSEGNATAGSFDANHIYADNGVYTVTVTVKDDDGGVTVKQFQVTVQNVDPTLTFTNPSIVVDEGAPITLAGLGVGAADPGFDNDALGTQETFQGATVDWGDGSASDSLTVSVGAKGSAGNATTGVFAHAAHHYADNGIYTVTVRFKDDDGGFVDRTFTISVENVAPSLDLTTDVFVINEGDTLNLPNLGTFSDPGFNNPSNPSGASQESFKYTINWGDGTTETGVLPASVTDGSPGVATIGTLVDSHLYADNDADNKYTITVTLEDDDGGTVTKAIEVTVLNVNPALNPIVATDVNTKGQTTLTLQFDDPGADEFDVVVDWGDTVETIHVPANSKGQPLTYTHTYSGPPDPLNPTADITITVQILDDDFGTPGVAAIGASNVEAVAISQPGLGAEKFRIDTTPQVAILTFPDRQVVPLLRTNVDARLATTTTVDVGGGGGDARATSERFLELRVINPDGTEGPGYRLPAKVLNNLPALFRNLPDNHYKIFLVQSETNSRRLVIEVFVRNGKLIDPGDDSEGARDRPPTEEATTRPVDQQPAAEQGEPAPVAGEPVEPQASSQWRHGPRSSTAIYHSATLAGVAIALSGAGKSSFRTLEEALARAKPDQWKRLRSAATHRPKKPR
ncbi:MAG: PKD domain-containing protein [Planctomycetaceae bacterium]|nr:PKD domain-containing protein [Planctomycetaceae bacterium]